MKSSLLKVGNLAKISLLMAATHLACGQTVWKGINGSSATTNWSDGLNWSGGSGTGGAPGQGDTVVFYDTGGTTAGVTNSFVDAAFTSGGIGTIGSLQYGQTNGAHTTLIGPGLTLSVSSGVTVGTGTDNGASQQVVAAIAGAGGTLNITGGSLISRQGSNSSGSHKATLDMSGLDTLTASIANLFVAVAGSTSSDQNRINGAMYLAKTNTITISGGAAPLLDVGDTLSQGNGASGASLYLGQTNAIFVDSVAVAQVKQSSDSMLFNPAFISSRPAAYFRGSDTMSRVATWSIADGGANSGSTATPTGTNDFTGGTVDAQVNVMTLGRTTSKGTGTRLSAGTLTFNAGTFDVNIVTNGWQTVAGDIGIGIINVNGTGKLVVNTLLEMGRVSGSGGTNKSSGTLNINGGTVLVNQINANLGSVSNTITMNGGSLLVSNSVSPGINTFNMTNATLTLAAVTGGTPMTVTNFTTGGAGNTMNISSVPPVSGYPTTPFTMLKYSGTIGGAGFNFNTTPGFPSSSTPYAGYISNDNVSHSIQLVVTGGPAPARVLNWNGTPGANWDVGVSSDWKNNGIGTYYNQADFVTFDDTALGSTSVSLAAQVMPTSLTVSNNTKTYTFGGNGGYISGSVGLNKLGNGTLILDNNGSPNDFTGGVTIGGGTLQVGNSDMSGNIPSAAGVIDNGSLVFKRTDQVTIANAISGSGTITQDGTANGLLELSGANTFTGAVAVVSGILRVGNNSALGATNGATTISSGATLDVGGASGTAAANSVDFRTEPIIVSGSGVNQGSGAIGGIVNNGSAQQQNALGNVTLAGNTTFGGNSRWDIRSATGKPASLMTGGNAYKITKIGANQVSLVSVSPIDPALGDIEVQSGIFGVQLSTAQLGDTNHFVTVDAGATLELYNLSTPLNKQVVLNGNGDGSTASLLADNGNSVVTGPVTLNGPNIINVSGTSLTINGNLSGSGNLIKYNGGGTLTLNGVNSYAGPTVVNGGTLVVNTSLGGIVTNLAGSTLAGNGSYTGTVDVQGNINPGTVGGAGTLTMPTACTLEAGAGFAFDLNGTNTANGGVSDRLELSGNLDTTLGAPNFVINPIQGRLQAGKYRLIDYSGAFLGSLGSAYAAVATRYSFALDTGTAHQVNLVVTGSAMDLTWNATIANGVNSWDLSSYTWQDPSAVTQLFYNGDTVTFDDSISGVTNSLVIGSNVVVMPWAITNKSTVNNYTISGQGKISGWAALVKDGSSMLTVSTTNDFTGPVTVLGGTLRVGASAALGSTNGGTTIASGATLDVGAPTYAANALNLGAEAITVGGTGVGGNGAIVNSSTNQQQNALRFVTLSTDTTFGGIGRWDIRNPNNSDIAASSNAVLSTSGQPYNLTKIGTNTVSLVGLVVDPALANINVEQGTLSIEHASTLGDPTKMLTVTNEATLQFWQTWPSNLLNKVLVVYGDGISTNINNSSGSNIFVGPVMLNSQTGTNCVLNVYPSPAPSWLMLSNNLVSGAAGLTKVGSGMLVLAGTNTYTGTTLVNAGTLALAGFAGLSNSPSIVIATNAMIDVTGRADGALDLMSGQVLSGNGVVNGVLNVNPGATVSPGIGAGTLGVLTMSNTVNLAGTATMHVVTGGTSDQIRDGTINYGGTLNMVFSPGTLVAGDSFQLFKATGGVYNGTFNNITPASPGPNLAWNTSSLNIGVITVVAVPQAAFTYGPSSGPAPLTVSFTNTSTGAYSSALWTFGDGTTSTDTSAVVTHTYSAAPPVNTVTLAVTNSFGFGSSYTIANAVTVQSSSAPSAPAIGGIRVSGGNLILHGTATNTLANKMYYVFTSTNVALPHSNWTAIATNSFDATGAFSVTNAIDATTRSRFYLIGIPWPQ